MNVPAVLCLHSSMKVRVGGTAGIVIMGSGKRSLVATPSEKSPVMEAFLEDAFRRTTLITADICVTCGEEARLFEDDLSRKEYTISGMCQLCQNKVFPETL